jgi:hypothetical protein
MSWDPGRVLRDLFNMIPGPRREIARPGIKESGTPLRSYGCCPACRAFVCISLSDRVRSAPCPNCGCWICSVNPLGAEDSTRISDDL